jgi:DNA-binding transcriptional LysR family regulator
VALTHFTPTLRELSRAFPGLELKLRRGSGTEVAEFLKSGTAELVIAGPLDETWSRLDQLLLFEEPFVLVVNRSHRLAGRDKAEVKDLASENLLINTGCEMADEVRAYLEVNGILDAVTYQVATQEDLLALLRADLGVAVMPAAGMEADGICCIPLKQLDLARPVSAYTVAGRHREIVCATLFNMLRAADWGFDTQTKQQGRAHR